MTTLTTTRGEKGKLITIVISYYNYQKLFLLCETRFQSAFKVPTSNRPSHDHSNDEAVSQWQPEYGDDIIDDDY